MNNNEEKRINLEGIMYNEDGTFKPLTASHGNIDADLAHLRNTYMESERAYFEHLLADPKLRQQFSEYLEYDAESLFDLAMDIQMKLESGELETKLEKEMLQSKSPEIRDAYHMQRLEYAEGVMCLLFAAARDKALIKELIFTCERGRSR